MKKAFFDISFLNCLSFFQKSIDSDIFFFFLFKIYILMRFSEKMKKYVCQSFFIALFYNEVKILLCLEFEFKFNLCQKTKRILSPTTVVIDENRLLYTEAAAVKSLGIFVVLGIVQTEPNEARSTETNSHHSLSSQQPPCTDMFSFLLLLPHCYY